MTSTRRLDRRYLLALVLACLSFSSTTAQSPAPTPHRPRKAVTRYTNSVYGVVFTYPKHLVVKEGDLPGADMGKGFPGSLNMAFVKDGGTRIATVEIPAASYPNTDFVNAFFSVSIHLGLTAEQCAQFDPDDFPKINTREISSIRFQGIDDSEGAMGHLFSGKTYHGLSAGRCFELSYGLATAGFGAVEGMKHVDDKAIMALLESILPTLKIVIPVSIAAPAKHARRASWTRPGAGIASLESARQKQAEGMLVSSR